MFERSPEAIATKLGLEFTVVEKKDAKGVVVAKAFQFRFPEYGARFQQTVNVRAAVSAETQRKANDFAATKEGKQFAGVVELVTKWREKVKPWLFDPQPSGEAGIVVAAELSFGNRFRVASTNRANRKAIKKFMAPEALARRMALAQTDPNTALKALDETLKLYGVTKPEAETLKLKKSLEKAAAIVALDGDTVPAGVTYQ